VHRPALSHIAHALRAINEQMLLARHARVVDSQAYQPLFLQAADEEAARTRERRHRIELRPDGAITGSQ
jgi:hypothetical protein